MQLVIPAVESAGIIERYGFTGMEGRLHWSKEKVMPTS